MSFPFLSLHIPTVFLSCLISCKHQHYWQCCMKLDGSFSWLGLSACFGWRQFKLAQLLLLITLQWLKQRALYLISFPWSLAEVCLLQPSPLGAQTLVSQAFVIVEVNKPMKTPVHTRITHIALGLELSPRRLTFRGVKQQFGAKNKHHIYVVGAGGL